MQYGMKKMRYFTEWVEMKKANEKVACYIGQIKSEEYLGELITSPISKEAIVSDERFWF